MRTANLLHETWLISDCDCKQGPWSHNWKQIMKDDENTGFQQHPTTKPFYTDSIIHINIL